MHLRTYLRTHGETQAAFAKRTGYHQITVCKWATGRAFPRAAALRNIETATDGAVRANDFCPGAAEAVVPPAQQVAA